MLSYFTPTCPLTMAECTDTCAWADVVVTISDEGIAVPIFEASLYGRLPDVPSMCQKCRK